MREPSVRDYDTCSSTLQFKPSAQAQSMKRPRCSNDCCCSHENAGFVVFSLPQSRHAQHAQPTASDVAALRTLQPHNHGSPKYSHEFPSLNARANATSQASGSCISAMEQAGHHDSVKAHHQIRHKNSDVLAAIHR
jgi:hypothetical protein